jgi:hypothetical protein
MAKAVRSIHRGTPSVLTEVAAFVQDLVRSLYDPYRPELHYMRGPGPKWHAKHDHRSAAYQAIPALVPVRVRRFPR